MNSKRQISILFCLGAALLLLAGLLRAAPSADNETTIKLEMTVALHINVHLCKGLYPCLDQRAIASPIPAGADSS